MESDSVSVLARFGFILVALGLTGWLVWFVASKAWDSIASRIVVWMAEIAEDTLRRTRREDAWKLNSDQQVIQELRERLRRVEIATARLQVALSEHDSQAGFQVENDGVVQVAAARIFDHKPRELPEDLGRRFISHCDEAVPEAEAAVDWFRDQGVNAEIIADGISGWGMIRVEQDNESVVVPAVRQPMGRTPLGEFFVLSGYNGVDFLKPAQIAKLARMRRAGTRWELESKGLITGA